MAWGSDNQINISNQATLRVCKQEQEDVENSFGHRLEIESFSRARELVRTLTTKTYNQSHLFPCSASLKREMIRIQFCFRNLVKTLSTRSVCFLRPENASRSENQGHALCAWTFHSLWLDF